MEIGFQDPEWKPMIDARFKKFKVSIDLNIIILMKLFFYNFELQGNCFTTKS